LGISGDANMFKIRRVAESLELVKLEEELEKLLPGHIKREMKRKRGNGCIVLGLVIAATSGEASRT
jgi:hypothetical protein